MCIRDRGISWAIYINVCCGSSEFHANHGLLQPTVTTCLNRSPLSLTGGRPHRPVAFTAGQSLCFSEDSSKGWSKARPARARSTSVLLLPQRGVGGGTGHSPFKVRHHPVDALKSGSCIRSAQTTAPARGVQQLAAAFAAKLPMVSALVPGATAAPAMRERCVRACWACALLIPRSRACPSCRRCQG